MSDSGGDDVNQATGTQATGMEERQKHVGAKGVEGGQVVHCIHAKRMGNRLHAGHQPLASWLDL